MQLTKRAKSNRARLFRKSFYPLVLLCALAGCSAAAAPPPPELYHLMREAQLKVRAADDNMIAYMKQCSELLSRHYKLEQKLPRSLNEFETKLSHSKLYTAKNPYFESELLRRELPANTSHLLQFEVITDYALSPSEFDSLAKHPPTSWKGLPGTIIITQNSENAFSLRAYGIDGKPVRDDTTNGAFYILKDCSQLQE